VCVTGHCSRHSQLCASSEQEPANIWQRNRAHDKAVLMQTAYGAGKHATQAASIAAASGCCARCRQSLAFLAVYRPVQSLAADAAVRDLLRTGRCGGAERGVALPSGSAAHPTLPNGCRTSASATDFGGMWPNPAYLACRALLQMRSGAACCAALNFYEVEGLCRHVKGPCLEKITTLRGRLQASQQLPARPQLVVLLLAPLHDRHSRLAELERMLSNLEQPAVLSQLHTLALCSDLPQKDQHLRCLVRVQVGCRHQDRKA